MCSNRLIISALFLLELGLMGLQAQESVNATGGHVSSGAGSVNYSVGEVVYTTHTGTNGTVAEGVQQPYEISVVTGIVEAEDIELSVEVYPNPTTNFLELKVESESLKNLSFHLYDMNGRLLQKEKLSAVKTQIDLSSYVPSSYFVKIRVEKEQGEVYQEVKTFKIIKK